MGVSLSRNMGNAYSVATTVHRMLSDFFRYKFFGSVLVNDVTGKSKAVL
jgi:hypothetical protein